MREITFIEAVREAQAEALISDDRVFIMGQEIGSYGGVFRATQDFVRRFGDHRVRDMPIAEQSMLGAGVGAAVMGMRPIVEVMFMDFVACGMDAIVNHAAKMCYMSGGQLTAPMVIRTQGGSGTHHGSQHSQTLESWFLHVPGLAVVVPSTPRDVKGLFKTSLDLDHPVLFLEHRALYRDQGRRHRPGCPHPARPGGGQAPGGGRHGGGCRKVRPSGPGRGRPDGGGGNIGGGDRPADPGADGC